MSPSPKRSLHRFVVNALFAIVLLSHNAPAQTDTSPPPPDPQPAEQQPAAPEIKPDPLLATPEDTLMTFVGAMSRYAGGREPEDLGDAMNCLDLAGVPIRATREDITANLYNILNRIGYVHRGQFPIKYDSDAFVYFPRPDESPAHARLAIIAPGFKIALAKGPDANWRINTETIGSIDAAWSRLEKQRPVVNRDDVVVSWGQRIRAQMPEKLRTWRFASLEGWQWLMLAGAILLGVILDHLVRGVLSLIWRRIEKRRDLEHKPAKLRKSLRSFGWLAAGGLWYALLELGGLPPLATTILLVAVRLILSLAAVLCLWRLIDLGASVLTIKAQRTRTKFDDLLVPLVARTAKIFAAAIGLIYIAQSFDIEILPLLTGLGLGGLAVAFAAKDTIENFFGSIAVILDRPFEVDDWVKIGSTEGAVESMGLRSTRIRTAYNSLVTIPNAELVRATVDNYGRRQYRRFKATLGLTYDTPPDKIEAFCAGIRELIRVHPYSRKDGYHAWLDEFSSSSLDVLVYMFFTCTDRATELRERHRFMLDMIRLADRLGVEFAFPTQTLHMFKEEHGTEHTPADPPGSSVETEAHTAGADAARAITADQPWQQERPGPVFYG